MLQKSNKTVFDASAVIALFDNEDGSQIAGSYVSGAVISAVNFSEILAYAIREGMYNQQFELMLKELLPEIISFDSKQANLAASLVPFTKQYGLSFADRACVALGKSMNLPVITADKVWKQLDVGVEVILIR